MYSWDSLPNPELITGYDCTSNRHNDFLTQLPFELKLTMPATDRGGRGYSDEYVAAVVKELLNA